MRLPVIVRFLLIANVLMFLLQQATGDALFAHFALWPLGPQHVVALRGVGSGSVGFEPWQLVTYSFLHGNFPHIAFNMLALWMFGAPVENSFGPRRFAIFYFACVLGAAVAQLATTAMFQPDDFYPTVGASGGVFGLLLAFAMLYPRATIMIYFIPLPAPVAVIGYMILELVLGVTGTQAGVAHFAHLGGALVGFVLIQYWRMQRQRRE